MTSEADAGDNPAAVADQAPETRRIRIIEASIACLHDYGFAKVTMEDVAQRAGLARISVYREFGSREALIRAVIMYRAERFNFGLSGDLWACTSLAEAVELYLMASIELTLKDRVTQSLIRGPIDFTGAGSPHHGIVRAIFAPLIERARARGEIGDDPAVDDIVEWLLITQFTTARLAMDGPMELGRLRLFVRTFVCPAFTRIAD